MKDYYVDTCGKLTKIFEKHCNLSMEQYEEISSLLLDLVAEVQEFDGEGTYLEAERKANDLGVIFEFLLNTKEITLEEYNELCNLVGKIADDAKRIAEEEENNG